MIYNLANVTLTWQAVTPIALATLGLIAWLIKKILTDREEDITEAKNIGRSARNLAIDRCDAIDQRCDRERDVMAGMTTQIAVMHTELKAHRSEVRVRLDKLEELVVNGGR